MTDSKTSTLHCRAPEWTLTFRPLSSGEMRITGTLGAPDPEMPRLPSAMELYLKEQYPPYMEALRAKLVSRQIEIPSYLEVRRRLAGLWRELPEATREVYEQQAQDHRDQVLSDFAPVTATPPELSTVALLALYGDWGELVSLLDPALGVPYSRLDRERLALALLRLCEPGLTQWYAEDPAFLQLGSEEWSSPEWLDQLNTQLGLEGEDRLLHFRDAYLRRGAVPPLE